MGQLIWRIGEMLMRHMTALRTHRCGRAGLVRFYLNKIILNDTPRLPVLRRSSTSGPHVLIFNAGTPDSSMRKQGSSHRLKNKEGDTCLSVTVSPAIRLNGYLRSLPPPAQRYRLNLPYYRHHSAGTTIRQHVFKTPKDIMSVSHRWGERSRFFFINFERRDIDPYGLVGVHAVQICGNPTHQYLCVSFF